MPPTPIQPGLVHLVLQYIAPPSQLTQPIPPHFLSKSVLQRHHFLQITPDDPQEYLCWPSSRGRAVELLEDFPQRPDDEPVSYPVQYTSDAEETLAHVCLPVGDGDGVRLVFKWDESDGWKYHDLAMMPFPLNSSASPEQIPTKETEYIAPPVQSVPALSYADNLHGGDGSDDDDYWNAYGAQDDAAPSNDDTFMAGKDAEAGTEDAYWARYSSVHGTADSTRPSPPPQPKRKLHPADADIHPGGDSPNPLPVPAHSDSYYSHGSTLTIPASFTTYGNSRWDPASPRTLARLLADVPPRETPSPSPLSASEEPDAASESEVSSPTVGGSSGSDSDQGCLTSLPDHMDEPLTARAVGPHPLTKFVEDEAETGALRDGIRGLWKLWETGRRKRCAYGGTDSDKELFLEIVKDVVSLS